MKVSDYIRLLAGILIFAYILYQFYETGTEPSKWIIGLDALLIVGKMSDLTDLVKAFKGKNNN